MGRNQSWSRFRQGYGVKGSGGFNSGLEARDKWRDKTIDDLRVKTNPKVSYGGVILGPKGKINVELKERWKRIDPILILKILPTAG